MDKRTGPETQPSHAGTEEDVLLERGSKLRSFFAKPESRPSTVVVASYSSDDRARYFRVTANALLVHEDAWLGFLDKYAEWLAQESGKPGDRIRAKIKNIVYGPSVVVTDYIFEGKTPVPVVTVKARFENPRALNLPLYNGMPVPANTSIHPKDPLVSTLPFLSGYDGTTFTVRWKGSQAISISSAVFSKLRGYLDMVPGIAEEYPAMLISNRELLRKFDVVINMVRTAKPHLPLLVPARYARHGAYTFLLIGKLVLVQEKGSIIDAYSTRGRCSEQFFCDEYRALLAHPPRKPLKEGGKGLHLVKEEEGGKPVLGRIDTFHKQALVTARTINECIGFLLSTTTNHALPSRFTLLDVLIDLRGRLGKAAPVRDADIPRDLFEKVQKGSLVVRNGGWYFVLDGKGIIRGVHCHERRAAHESRKGSGSTTPDTKARRGRTRRRENHQR